MTNRDLFTALRTIDQRFIDEAAPGKRGANTHRRMLWIPVAACICVMAVLMAAIAIPMLRGGAPVVTDGAGDPTAGTHFGNSAAATESQNDPVASDTPEVTLPRLPVGGNGNLAGELGFEIQSGEYVEEAQPELAPPSFDIGAVVEARVIEVLPDSYSMANGSIEYHIAKLQILDEIHGTGFPEVIYFRYDRYGTDIFDGCDSLILSLRQIGIENYLMINRTEGVYEYFPNMFMLLNSFHLGYGRLIAFRDGVLYEDFYNRERWEPIRHILEGKTALDYPAVYGNTVEEVKENIRNYIIEEQPYEAELYRCDYVSKEEVFDSARARQMLSEVQPGENNVFEQYFEVYSHYTYVSYTRLIGGFKTEETISIRKNRGEASEISKNSNVSYSPEDWEAVPDLSVAMAWLKEHLSEIALPHITAPEDPSYSCCKVSGYFRKADGEIYGIVRILWIYQAVGVGNFQFAPWEIRDDCYIFFDSEGGGRMLEREELREIIGDDRLIQEFPYEYLMLPMV